MIFSVKKIDQMRRKVEINLIKFGINKKFNFRNLSNANIKLLFWWKAK